MLAHGSAGSSDSTGRLGSASVADVLVRGYRSGDAPGIVRVSRDSGAYYERIAPELFRSPDTEGFVEFLEADTEWREQPANLALVAEVNGEVAGYLEASIQDPLGSARWQTQRDLGAMRLFIGYVGTAERFRRRGVATQLVEAAEEWGRPRGAVVAICDTFLGSDLSAPFWEERMGYARQAIILRKPLT